MKEIDEGNDAARFKNRRKKDYKTKTQNRLR